MEEHSYPLGTDGLNGRALVDALFTFSSALGTDYSGSWSDDSTFRVAVLDATGSEDDRPTAGVLNVTARPSGGITSFNLTAKTCFNLTNMRLHYEHDYTNLLHDPAAVNSSLHECELHYANSTSPTLGGDVGVPTFPTLLSATFDDPDNGDEAFSVGDVLVLQFDMPTNAFTAGAGAGGGSNATGGARADVDALFTFSDALGAEYKGEWVQPDRYIITVLDTTGGEVEIGVSELTVLTTGIRNAAGDALSANNQSVVLQGDFGMLSEPRITRFTVVVAANASNYTDGDTMVLHLDMATNRGGGQQVTRGDKAYVDALWTFSAVLGADYTGSWEPGESSQCADGGATTHYPCFVISLLDTRGGSAVSGATIAAPSISVRSASGRSSRLPNRLGGNRGRRLAPLLVSFHAADDDNSASGLDAGDVLTLTFDAPTNVGVTPPQPWGLGVGEGATSGGKAYVDSLFRFCRVACPSDAYPDDAWAAYVDRVVVGQDYSGAWADEATFRIIIVDNTSSTLSLGQTVAQPRRAGDAVASRPIRFRGGISEQSNATSPVLAGDLGVDDPPEIAAFVALDADHADVVYGAYDQLELRFSMPTDRGSLGSAAGTTMSGDKRWCDGYFEFSCNLGLDYSGEWVDPQAAVLTVLDGTIGYSPAALADADQLDTLLVTPARDARFRNKPGTSGTTASAVREPQPPLRGSDFPAFGSTRLCVGVEHCDFGDFSAPVLLSASISDVDNSGSWTANDYLRLEFDRATNRLGEAVGGGSLDAAALRQIFAFRAVDNLGSLDVPGAGWELGEPLRGSWTDASTLIIETLHVNDTLASHTMPDPTQCGEYDATNKLIPCPSQKALGGNTGAQGTFSIPAGAGFKLRVAINGSAGLRTASDSPFAASASGTTDLQMAHCYAGPLVKRAEIRDPDNLDTVYSNGDELTVSFSVDTDRPPVATKWDIDKLLTFCTPCNPDCSREVTNSITGALIDAEYNGLGAEYSGAWVDAATLVITLINVTLPNAGACSQNEGGSEFMNFAPNAWGVMTSYSATQAPMMPSDLAGLCVGGAYAVECGVGKVSGLTTTDQFGNTGLELFGRMLGPRYPHRWQSSGACEDYSTIWGDFQQGTYPRVPISGSVGPAGTPTIARLVASDPDDRDLVYGSGDTLTVVFDVATDRSNATQRGTYSGDRLFVDSLFAFNAQLGQDYSGAWFDDSQFVVTVLDATWRPGPAFGADGRVSPNNCTVALRPGLVVRNLASTSAALSGSSPPLTGDAGLSEPPTLVGVVGDDPDLGDYTVAFGDRLTLTFDRSTDRGCASVGSNGGADCPFAVGAPLDRATVDSFFNFSSTIGAAYEGTWRDSSVFVLTITDGATSMLNAELGTIMVNPINDAQHRVSNSGCRPGITDRQGRNGQCNVATAYVGPIVAVDGAPSNARYVANFGVTPRVVLISVDDPDNGDSVYGAGDVVRVYFDQATDGKGAGDSAYVDSIMSFSMPLGVHYIGAWEDASTFAATVISTVSVPVARADFLAQGLGTEADFAALDTTADAVVEQSEFQSAYRRLSVVLKTEIRDLTSRSRPSLGMAPATPDEALLRSQFPVYDPTTPKIVNVTAEDPDNGDSVFGVGDVIRVSFAASTDLGAVSGSKPFVDRLFRFDPPIGQDYTGAWVDDRTFRVRALDTVGGALLVCNHAGCAPSERSNVTLIGTLRNRGDTSPIAVSSAHVSGVSGSGAPRLERFEVRDPDNLDYVFSNDDQVTIVFDRATDLGAVEGRRKRVDALFSFNIALGEDYSGQWLDDSVFVITITDTRYDLPLINQTVVSAIAPIRAANGTGEPANVTSGTLRGHFGRARKPRLSEFAVSRLRRNLGLDAGPPLYSLTFDEPTNRTCAYCEGNTSAFMASSSEPWSIASAKAAVDELFSFSVLLGGSYSGAWADDFTFEVTVLDVRANMSYGETPAVGRTTANVTGVARLYSKNGRLPSSVSEMVTLVGNAAMLRGPYTDQPPTPVLPRIVSFLLLDAGEGGLRGDGSFGANATLLLEFNITAHGGVGDVWRHEFVHENVSFSFPGGRWEVAGDGTDAYAGVHLATEGLQFSQTVGLAYTGTWLSRTRLLVRVLVPSTDASRARVGVATVHTRIGPQSTAAAILALPDTTTRPRLMSVVADDPDESDYVYSSGDTVTLSFDRPTDRAGGARAGNKAFVDGLFTFTQALAYDYSGEWLPGLLDGDSAFRITILQATCPGCTPFPGIATVKPVDTASIRTRSGSSPRASAPSPPLSGDYGKTRGPQIVSFVADDFDNSDDIYSASDTLTVTFDLPTDRGGTDAKATSVEVEDMLIFSQPLGDSLFSQWSDDSTLVITIISPEGAGDVLVGKSTVRPRRRVRNAGCCAAYTREGCAVSQVCCCYNATDLEPVPLSGDFGTLQPPAIASFVGDDPDDGDGQYGGSDVLLVKFDMATDRAKGDPFGNKQWVDGALLAHEFSRRPMLAIAIALDSLHCVDPLLACVCLACLVHRSAVVLAGMS